MNMHRIMYLMSHYNLFQHITSTINTNSIIKIPVKYQGFPSLSTDINYVIQIFAYF